MEQESDSEVPTLFNHALKWGIIGGAISIVFVVVLYVVDYTAMVTLKFLFLSLLISLGLMSYAGVDYRKSIGGFLPYGKAWQHSYIAFVTSGIAYTLFAFLLYFVIDPDLPARLVDASMENQRAMMENFGAPADQIDAEVEKGRARTEGQFTVSGLALGFGISLIIYAVLSLITALFGRKNPPMDQM
jgi:hypothetical protein